ncbi:TVP38/TMEM64 family protein [Acidaminobacter sp. JC074]|uniref:TVP38/TMEM64 family protein n=1 Tax=Acidaminobacter sp. JC074 TaxID=2530199 RepID=UPI001F0E9A12|nr:TVP38/TMEM64 family protein [Acidaminobacter sp. JC074]MCH4889951.1 TVP38/TMEM64 family protein [Acidaminobacter sp. JC074]
MKNLNKYLILNFIVPILVILVLFMIEPVRTSFKQAIFILSSLNVDIVRGYILSYGILAPVVSFLLMVFQSIAAPLPAFMITFANAGLFGWVKGAILSWTSSMAGAALCFYLAKYFGRGLVEKLTSKLALESIDNFFDKYGNYAVLIARLLPFMSFDIVSYAAGLTSMSFWKFFIATGIGQLPATLVYSYVGGMLVGGTKMLVFGLLILFALTTMIFLFKRIYSDKQKKETQVQD